MKIVLGSDKCAHVFHLHGYPVGQLCSVSDSLERVEHPATVSPASKRHFPPIHYGNQKQTHKLPKYHWWAVPSLLRAISASLHSQDLNLTSGRVSDIRGCKMHQKHTVQGKSKANMSSLTSGRKR